MQRHREIAAAPERSTSETVETISALIRDSLARSRHIDPADVDDALDAARPALLALVAGGHLEKQALVLAAASLHVSITTVSGDKALTLEENLDAVPGAASATEWTLYLPTPDPLGALVTSCAEKHPRLSTDEPPSADEQDQTAEQSAAAALDREALIRRSRA
jgi:hypothetical protein